MNVHQVVLRLFLNNRGCKQNLYFGPDILYTNQGISGLKCYL